MKVVRLIGASFACGGLLVAVAPSLFSSHDIEPESEPLSRGTPASNPQVQDPACPPLVVYDTHGSSDEADWTEVTTNGYRPEHVRDLVIDNGLVRATYEYLNDQQEGSHTLRLWNGSEWQRTTSSWYGDYTYWVSTLTEPAVDAVVTRKHPNVIEVSYEFEHHPPYLVPYVHLVKRVALQRCEPGMFVKFESNPRNPPGEREFGIGEAAPLTFSERAVGFHPYTGGHVNLGLLADEALPWAAALGEDDVLRVMALRRPMLTLSYQFDPAHHGRVSVNKLDEADGELDYQVYLGAVPFEGAGAVVEAESGYGTVTYDSRTSAGAYATIGFGNYTVLEVDVPADGDYALWARSRAGIGSELEVDVDGVSSVVMNRVSTGFEMEPLMEVELEQGAHTLTLTALSATTDLDAIAVLPVGLARQLAGAGAHKLKR